MQTCHHRRIDLISTSSESDATEQPCAHLGIVGSMESVRSPLVQRGCDATQPVRKQLDPLARTNAKRLGRVIGLAIAHERLLKDERIEVKFGIGPIFEGRANKDIRTYRRHVV